MMDSASGTDRIEEITKRLEAAAPGPWTADDLTEEVLEDYKEFFWKDCRYGCPDDECEGHFEERAYMIHGLARVPMDGDVWYFNEGDAQFISHSPEDMAYLLKLVKEKD